MLIFTFSWGSAWASEKSDSPPPLNPPAGSLEFQDINLTAYENEGFITIEIDRIGGTEGEVSIPLFTQDNTAIEGQDYFALSQIVTWVDGDSEPKFVLVPIINDGVFDNNETFSVHLGVPLGGATITGASQITITIKSFKGAFASPPLSKNLIHLNRSERAEINYQLNLPGHIKITIFDRLGREIIKLMDSDQLAGIQTQIWDGRDQTGNMVKPAVYRAVISENGAERRLKIIVLR